MDIVLTETKPTLKVSMLSRLLLSSTSPNFSDLGEIALSQLLGEFIFVS